MTAAASSREAILSRCRPVGGSAVARDADYAALPRSYIRRGTLDRQATLDLMIERLREYDAEVLECSPSELAATIAAQLAGSGRRIIAVPAGLPSEWLAAGFEWMIDPGPNSAELAIPEIETAQGVVTCASCAVANSGTIVLHHTAREGRRVLTLLPDWHLCILNASQVVETFPEYFSRFEQQPPLVTWISGPSATADIEMTRIKGVHGPRFLVVLLVRDEI